MAQVNTQVEVRKGKNPKKATSSSGHRKGLQEIASWVIRTKWKPSSPGSSKQKSQNRHSTMCGVITVHSLGDFFREEGKTYCSYSKQIFVIYVNQKCSQDDVLEEGSVFVQMGSGEHS